jgi:hypothetical protein
VRSTKEANNSETARKLWEVSEKWLKELSSSQTEKTEENPTECA